LDLGVIFLWAYEQFGGKTIPSAESAAFSAWIVLHPNCVHTPVIFSICNFLTPKSKDLGLQSRNLCRPKYVVQNLTTQNPLERAILINYFPEIFSRILITSSIPIIPLPFASPFSYNAILIYNGTNSSSSFKITSLEIGTRSFAFIVSV